jgi:hypothetical protein
MPAEQYPENWDEIRRDVYQRDGYECQTCGAQGGQAGNTELHAHHKTPISEGGSNEMSNLVTLCKSCHNNQHDHDITGEDDSEPMVPLSVGVKAGQILTIQQYRSDKGFLQKKVAFPLLILFGYIFVFNIMGLIGGLLFRFIPVVPTVFGALIGFALSIPIGVSWGLSSPKDSILAGLYFLIIFIPGLLFQYEAIIQDFQVNILGAYGILGGIVYVLLVPLLLILMLAPTTTACLEYLTGGGVSDRLS